MLLLLLLLLLFLLFIVVNYHSVIIICLLFLYYYYYFYYYYYCYFISLYHNSCYYCIRPPLLLFYCCYWLLLTMLLWSVLLLFAFHFIKVVKMQDLFPAVITMQYNTIAAYSTGDRHLLDSMLLVSRGQVLLNNNWIRRLNVNSSWCVLPRFIIIDRASRLDFK